MKAMTAMKATPWARSDPEFAAVPMVVAAQLYIVARKGWSFKRDSTFASCGTAAVGFDCS